MEGGCELILLWLQAVSCQRTTHHRLHHPCATNLRHPQDPHLQRHAIDLHLRRYDRALSNIAAAGPSHFDTALKLAQAHGLLRQLISILQQQQKAASAAAAAAAAVSTTAASTPAGDLQRRLQRALSAHAAALQSQRRYEDAAVAYLAANAPDLALHAYLEGGHWRMALALAGRFDWSKARVQGLARELASTLLSSGQAADAAKVLREYLGDVDGAVGALVAAKEWREALRVAYAESRWVWVCGLAWGSVCLERVVIGRRAVS